MRQKRLLASFSLIAAVLGCLAIAACVTDKQVQEQVAIANSAEDRMAEGTLRRQSLERERTLLEQRLDAAPVSERPAIEHAIKAVDERILVVEIDVRRAAREFAQAEAMIDQLDKKLNETPGRAANLIEKAGEAAGNAGVPGAGLIGQAVGGIAHEAITWITTGGLAAATIAAFRQRRKTKVVTEELESTAVERDSLQNVIAINEHLDIKEVVNDPKVKALAKMLVEWVGAKEAFEKAKRVEVALPQIPDELVHTANTAPVTS